MFLRDEPEFVKNELMGFKFTSVREGAQLYDGGNMLSADDYYWVVYKGSKKSFTVTDVIVEPLEYRNYKSFVRCVIAVDEAGKEYRFLATVLDDSMRSPDGYKMTAPNHLTWGWSPRPAGGVTGKGE